MAHSLKLTWSPLSRVKLSIPFVSQFACQYIKRDDCLNLEGNKARKLHLLAAISNARVLIDFQQAVKQSGNACTQPLTADQSESAKQIKAHSRTQVLSWGGNQSNAMMALAQLCKHREWNFTYLTPPISTNSKPLGNHKATRYLRTQLIGSVSDEDSKAIVESLCSDKLLVVR
jgi:1-aminocyclopropane-1-carboxylate deaminase/D-cysteine desulfhydrase-like pyridoxal-dependent ACC family enzyme